MCPGTNTRRIEIYGEKGSLLVPDPNYFGGAIEFAEPRTRIGASMPTEHAYADDNYRIIGVADMAQAIRSEPPASRERRARLSCARSDGGVSDARRIPARS